MKARKIEPVNDGAGAAGFYGIVPGMIVKNAVESLLKGLDKEYHIQKIDFLKEYGVLFMEYSLSMEYSIFFLFFGFSQWRSRAGKVLTLNMNIQLPLFWSTWSPARGQDSATSVGLAHGRDYSYCRA